MQSIRDLANAMIQAKRSGPSIRERIARGEIAYDWACAQYAGASSGTVRKWRRTHEAREAGWLK